MLWPLGKLIDLPPDSLQARFLIPLEAHYIPKVTYLQSIWPLRALVIHPKSKHKDQYEKEKDVHIRTILLPVAPAKTLLLGVLVSAETELIFILVAGIVLCFGFSVRILLITH